MTKEELTEEFMQLYITTMQTIYNDRVFTDSGLKNLADKMSGPDLEGNIQHMRDQLDKYKLGLR